ncbi:hypothetical protein SAMN05660380_00002 [Xylella fastidiosa]|jgi:hypothetical protein|nr:hypothetical protein SAMN05660380_00002 [Xylella fastidiosa]
MGDFCHILSGATGEGGEDEREEFAGCGCQKNLKDGQNRGDGGGWTDYLRGADSFLESSERRQSLTISASC